MPRSDEQIVRDANALARTFYKAHGYEVEEGFRFHLSSHPQEQMMWHLACIAYEELRGTPVEDALANLTE